MVPLMLSARRAGVTTTVVTDRVRGIRALQATVSSNGDLCRWREEGERLMLHQALLLIETPSGRQPFVLSGRSGREYDSDPV